MRGEIIKLGRHGLVYGLGIMLSKAVSFVMLPVYTRYLTPADYGTIELLTTTMDIIIMIAGIGLTATIFKYYSHYESQGEKNEVISTAIIMMLILCSLTATLGIILSPQLSKLVFHHQENSFYFQLIFIIYFFQEGMITISLLFIRALQNSKLFVSINLAKLLVQVFLNIYLLVVLKMGIVGILYSTLVADFLVALYLSVYAFKRVGFRYSLSKSREMVRFGFPFIFVSLSSFTLTFSDRYFLNVFSDLESVGVYALAYKFGFLMGYLSVTPFMQIWDPQRFEIAKQENALLIFKKVFLYFNIVVISLSLVICLFVKDVLTVMSDPAYLEAYRIAPIVILAYIIQGWTFYCNLGIYIKGQSQRMATASLLSAVGVIALNFLLIPTYGVYGAAWATVGAFFIRFILIHTTSQKLYPVNYGWNKQLLLLMVAVLIYIASRALETSQWVLSLGFNTLLASMFVVTTYLFFLEGSEKLALKEFIKNPIAVLKAAHEAGS
jgi:O-antigen/teichoic acid export membrane protein